MGGALPLLAETFTGPQDTKLDVEGKRKLVELAANADLWKVDCEGCEFALAVTSRRRDSARGREKGSGGGEGKQRQPRRRPFSLPGQIAVEIHTTYRKECASEEALDLFVAFARAGYVVAHREDNPSNEFVSEFTLVRAFCEEEEEETG